MRRLKLTMVLGYDADLMHGEDREAVDWFESRILRGPLVLWSNELGDELGPVEVIAIEEV